MNNVAFGQNCHPVLPAGNRRDPNNGLSRAGWSVVVLPEVTHLAFAKAAFTVESKVSQFGSQSSAV